MRNRLDLVRAQEGPAQFDRLKTEDLDKCLNRLPEEIFDLLVSQGPKLILAGGYIRALIADEKPRDIDLFISDQDQARKIALDFRNVKLTVSENAFSLEGGQLKIQVVYGHDFHTAEQLISEFDYTICKASIYHNGVSFVSTVSRLFYGDVANKILRVEHPSIRRKIVQKIVARDSKKTEHQTQLLLDDYERSIIRSHKFFELGYKPTEKMRLYADS